MHYYIVGVSEKDMPQIFISLVVYNYRVDVR